MGLAWIATQKAPRIAAVHGMVFGQPVRLTNALIVIGAMTSSNLYLPSNGNICFVSTMRVFVFGKFVGHYPPLLAALRCGGPFGAVPAPGFLELLLRCLASGCPAACFLANASRSVDDKDLFSLIQLFKHESAL